jgi:acyl-coenzyme A synthetase/AMP-(fatty) acid ligase
VVGSVGTPVNDDGYLYMIDHTKDMIINSFLKSQLVPVKVPEDFIVLEELAEGSTGKILKRELKKQLMDKLKN